MKSTGQDQEFLDEVYRKARILEYDKREAQKVLLNRKRLARQRNGKFAGILIAALAVFVMIRYAEIDLGMCLVTSFLLIGAGAALEMAEFTVSTDRDS